ncbi:uncharacterized protein LOC110659747 isoform X2 [Hevea brasiliensis]|uniref:uncharacterized protein LOC110659747 isoform X2 n=1 Tax=Hevea brasiliensis TaxID=3981 RepID=UPI0025F3D951|nr:uncharacterized protein LOC110659747 isoform X2 [Hevea brasiliensis]
MACVVSISFSTPLCARKFLLQELQLRKVPLAGLSSQATIRTATNLLAFYHSNRDIFSVRSCRGYLTSLDHFGELFPLCTIDDYQMLALSEYVAAICFGHEHTNKIGMIASIVARTLACACHA